MCSGSDELDHPEETDISTHEEPFRVRSKAPNGQESSGTFAQARSYRPGAGRMA